MSQLFKVVFTGELQPNIDPAQAARDFASVFKVSQEKALKLIREGHEKALKTDVDHANAQRYLEVLTDIGLRARIDPVSTLAQCPKCGSTRIRDGVCQGCGILVESFAALHRTAAPSEPPPAPVLAKPAAVPRSASAARQSAPPAATEDALGEPARVDMGHGWRWLAGGFALFKAAPLGWIGAILLFLVINLGLALIPVVGGLASTLLGPVFLAGFMFAADQQQRDGNLRVGAMFAGFGHNTGALIAVAGLYLLGILAISAIAGLGVALFASGMPAFDPEVLQQDDPERMMAVLGPGMLIILLLFMAGALPLMMAYWFAPALVMLDGLRPRAAMRLSLTACLRNIPALLLYGLLSVALLILAMIPALLGLLVVAPMLMASMYVSYRDIFHPSA